MSVVDQTPKEIHNSRTADTTKAVAGIAAAADARLPADRHIFRKHHDRNFTIIGNVPLNDERLSADALGLLIYVWSKPDDWVVMVDQLTKRFHCGRDKIDRCLKELIDAGYVIRRQRQAVSGRWASVEYDVYEEPQNQEAPLRENPNAVETQQNQSSAPRLAKPLPVKPLPVKPQLLSTESTKDESTKDKKPLTSLVVHTRQFEEVKKKRQPIEEVKKNPLSAADWAHINAELDRVVEMYDAGEEHYGEFPIQTVDDCERWIRELFSNFHVAVPEIQTTAEPRDLHLIVEWETQGWDLGKCFHWILDKMIERARAGGPGIRSLTYFDVAFQNGAVEFERA
jgi:hypothetical protein